MEAISLQSRQQGRWQGKVLVRARARRAAEEEQSKLGKECEAAAQKKRDAEAKAERARQAAEDAALEAASAEAKAERGWAERRKERKREKLEEKLKLCLANPGACSAAARISLDRRTKSTFPRAGCGGGRGCDDEHGDQDGGAGMTTAVPVATRKAATAAAAACASLTRSAVVGGRFGAVESPEG